LERERSGQKPGLFAEAEAALRIRLPCVSGQSLERWQLDLVAFVRREDATTVLVDTRLTGREPRRQGSYERVDARVRLGARAGTSPRLILGCGADGAGVAKRGLHGVGTRRQGRLGIRCTGAGRAAQRLEGVDFAVTLLAPLRVDGTLGRRLARLGRAAPPAVRDATRARWHSVIAIARRERCPRLGIGLGQDGLGVVQGRWNAGDPRETGLGQLGSRLGALERTVGHEIRGVGSGVELRTVVPDDLAERVAIMPMAPQGLHQHRDTGWVLPH
jgi:hypothetical protein